MYRFKIFTIFFSLSINLIFAQQNTNFRISGSLPNSNDQRMYRIQLGAFYDTGNAEAAYDKLVKANLSPVYETSNEITRVLVICNAADVRPNLELIKNAGFSEVFVRTETPSQSTAENQVFRAENQVFRAENQVVRPFTQLPVSAASVPDSSLREAASITIRVGETRNLAELTNGRNITAWRSSSSSVVVDENGNITGINIGNAYITINDSEYISVAIVPEQVFFTVPESMTSRLPISAQREDIPYRDFTEYRTEPTFRLAYRFNNKGENKGASGLNGGIDILARGPDYGWLWTTYYQGGWFYDLNGVKREMIDGFQKGSNGVTLTVVPEFVYDNGIPYLQFRQILHNTNNVTVTGQRFGASADVMMFNNDFAPLVLTPYGAYMTDDPNSPTIELVLICLSGNGINPVDTLWLGTYNSGRHLEFIYNDNRNNVENSDSAIGFSYQNIDLAPGEKKEFVVRFTLARFEK